MIGVIFHFWLGLVLALSGAAVTVALVASYLKVVTAAKYPHGKRNRDLE